MRMANVRQWMEVLLAADGHVIEHNRATQVLDMRARGKGVQMVGLQPPPQTTDARFMNVYPRGRAGRYMGRVELLEINMSRSRGPGIESRRGLGSCCEPRAH